MTVSYPFYKAAAEFITEASHEKSSVNTILKTHVRGYSVEDKSQKSFSCVRRSNLENKRIRDVIQTGRGKNTS